MKKYIELILEGDPQCTELLFVPEHLIERQTRFGKSIMDLGRKYALSNKIFARIMGYSNGEWRKAMAIKIVPEKRKKQEPEILNDFWNCYNWLTREEKELIISTFNKSRPHKVVSSVAGLGAKRKALVEKYGYCTKSAAHSIRLVRQVTELMLTGEIIFPRPDAELLKSIRNGELSKEDITRIYEESRATAESTREKSILNDTPNADKIWSHYLSIVVYQCSC